MQGCKIINSFGEVKTGCKVFLTDWHFTFPQTVAVLPIRPESHCLFSFLLVFVTIGSRSVRHALCLGVLTKPEAIREIISIINERFLISIHWAYIFSLFICLLTFYIYIKKKHVVYIFSRGRPCIKKGFRTF